MPRVYLIIYTRTGERNDMREGVFFLQGKMFFQAGEKILGRMEKYKKRKEGKPRRMKGKSEKKRKRMGNFILFILIQCQQTEKI